jgi:hypothetical protein
VFPVRYELNLYILCIINSAFKELADFLRRLVTVSRATVCPIKLINFKSLKV